MAEISDGGGGDVKGGKKRAKKSSTRVDMTPMVDLAFLLLTFFVLTSTFSKPKIMSLVYPAKLEDLPPNQKPPEVNKGITFLLSKDKIFYYEGKFRMAPEGAYPATTLTEVGFGPQGVRKLLADKNKDVIRKRQELDLELKQGKIVDSIYTKNLIKARKDGVKVLIKTDLEATCKNFIDLIDELKIADIGVIAPVDLTRDEETLMKAKLK